MRDRLLPLDTRGSDHFITETKQHVVYRKCDTLTLIFDPQKILLSKYMAGEKATFPLEGCQSVCCGSSLCIYFCWSGDMFAYFCS